MKRVGDKFRVTLEFETAYAAYDFERSVLTRMGVPKADFEVPCLETYSAVLVEEQGHVVTNTVTGNQGGDVQQIGVVYGNTQGD